MAGAARSTRSGARGAGGCTAGAVGPADGAAAVPSVFGGWVDPAWVLAGCRSPGFAVGVWAASPARGGVPVACVLPGSDVVPVVPCAGACWVVVVAGALPA